MIVVICLFCGLGKRLRTFICQSQVNTVFCSACRFIRERARRSALNLCTGQDDRTVFLKFLDGLRQYITCSIW